MKYKEAYQIAEEKDKKLTSFRKCIHVHHGDGSNMYFNHAEMEILDDKFLMVHTEHLGFRVFFLEDLSSYEELDMLRS
jgi:hypothetical protein